MALEKDQKGFLVAASVLLLVAVGIVYVHNQGGGGGGFSPSRPSKLLVCVVRETANESSIPDDQRIAMDDIAFRKWLDTHTHEITGVDGKPTHGYRFIDYDPSNPDRDRNLPSAFKKLIETHIKSLNPVEYPYVYISDGKYDGVEGNFPASPAERDKLFQEWGGP